MKYSNTAQLPRVRALPFFFRLGSAPMSRRIPFPEGSERGGGAQGVHNTSLAEPETAVFPFYLEDRQARGEKIKT